MEQSEVYDRLMNSIAKYDSEDYDFKYKQISSLLSVLSIIGYMIRHYQMSKAYGDIPETKMFTGCIIMLSFWNLVTNIFLDCMMLNVTKFLTYNNQIKLDHSTLSNIFENSQSNTSLNYVFFVKDFKIFVHILESFGLFKLFVQSVWYLTNSIQDRLQFIHKDLEVASKNEQVKRKEQKYPKRIITKVFKYIGIFVVTLLLIATFLPQRLILNSSAILYHSDTFTLKSEHFFWALDLIFICDNVRLLVQALKIAKGPRVLGIIQYCSWIYNFGILIVSNLIIILFHDLLINFSILINNILAGSNLYTEDNQMNFLTAIVLNYLIHSQNFSYGNMSTIELVDSLSKNLIGLKNTFVDCLVVLNFSCFVMIPFVMWLVMMELRFTTSRCARSI